MANCEVNTWGNGPAAFRTENWSPKCQLRPKDSEHGSRKITPVTLPVQVNTLHPQAIRHQEQDSGRQLGDRKTKDQNSSTQTNTKLMQALPAQQHSSTTGQRQQRLGEMSFYKGQRSLRCSGGCHCWCLHKQHIRHSPEFRLWLAHLSPCPLTS